MRKNHIFLFFLWGIICNSFAQKIIEREFDASSISAIEINSNIIFNITITTEGINKVKIRTSIEGENFENVLLSIKEENGLFNIKPEYSPYFKAKNDKLAAHKVLAIEMKLIVPENLEIKIKSNLASVKITGKYTSIEALLGTGNCILENFSGDAVIKTKQGFIKVFANASVNGTAFTKKGIVTNELINKGKYRLVAESFEGDISLFLIDK